LKFVKKRNRFFLVDKRYKLLTVKQSYTSKPIWFTFFVKNLRRRKRFIKRFKNSFKRLRINWTFRKIYNKRIKKLILTSSFSFRRKPFKIFRITKRVKNLHNRVVIANNFKKLNTIKQLFWANKLAFYLPASLINNLRRNTLNKFRFKLVTHTRVKSFIHSLVKVPVVFSKYNTKFIGKMVAFLNTSNTIVLDFFSKKFNKPYIIRKILYSFATKYEMHKYILKRYTRNRAINFIRRSPIRRKKFKSNYRFKYKYSANLAQNSHISNFFFNSSYFNNLTNLRTLVYKNFLVKNWSFYRGSLTYRNLINNRNVNIRIKRVKFKPGYMILWRNARTVLKQTMGLNFKYQHRLTNYLMRYRKFIRFSFYLNLEMQLHNIILKSRLVPDILTSNIFIENGLVFVNGLNCYNNTMQVYTGDFIQLIVNLKYYILKRWMMNWTNKKRLRLKRKSHKRTASYRHSDEKQRSRLLPDWILFNKHLVEDVIKYLEVDYLTLSVFVLYEPFLWSDINPYLILGIRFGVINLYNWKYIT